jgi:hypothetical protein
LRQTSADVGVFFSFENGAFLNILDATAKKSGIIKQPPSRIVHNCLQAGPILSSINVRRLFFGSTKEMKWLLAFRRILVCLIGIQYMISISAEESSIP